MLIEDKKYNILNEDKCSVKTTKHSKREQDTRGKV